MVQQFNSQSTMQLFINSLISDYLPVMGLFLCGFFGWFSARQLKQHWLHRLATRQSAQPKKVEDCDEWMAGDQSMGSGNVVQPSSSLRRRSAKKSVKKSAVGTSAKLAAEAQVFPESSPSVTESADVETADSSNNCEPDEVAQQAAELVEPVAEAEAVAEPSTATAELEMSDRVAKIMAKKAARKARKVQKAQQLQETQAQPTPEPEIAENGDASVEVLAEPKLPQARGVDVEAEATPEMPTTDQQDEPLKEQLPENLTEVAPDEQENASAVEVAEASAPAPEEVPVEPARESSRDMNLDAAQPQSPQMAQEQREAEDRPPAEQALPEPVAMFNSKVVLEVGEGLDASADWGTMEVEEGEWVQRETANCDGWADDRDEESTDYSDYQPEFIDRNSNLPGWGKHWGDSWQQGAHSGFSPSFNSIVQEDGDSWMVPFGEQRSPTGLPAGYGAWLASKQTAPGHVVAPVQVPAEDADEASPAGMASPTPHLPMLGLDEKNAVFSNGDKTFTPVAGSCAEDGEMLWTDGEQTYKMACVQMCLPASMTASTPSAGFHMDGSSNDGDTDGANDSGEDVRKHQVDDRICTETPEPEDLDYDAAGFPPLRA